jgi:acyl-CoA thioester hydrolase
MPYEFQIRRRVEFADTDMGGIVHFSRFFLYMESTEHAFLRSLGQSVVPSGSAICLPRVHASCDYRAPLYFEDEVLIHLLVQRKSPRSLTYSFLFRQVRDSAMRDVACGRLAVAGAQRQTDGTLKAAPIPSMILEKIQEAPPSRLADHRLSPEGRAAMDLGSETRGAPGMPAGHGSAPDFPILLTKR